MQSYQWKVLQEGTLAMKPNRQIEPVVEHRPTVVLLWPQGELPSPQNTLLTDPHFTDWGFEQAGHSLRQIGISFASIGHIFVTHYHFDHMPRLPAQTPQYAFKLFAPDENDLFPDLRAVDLPGHDPYLRGLAFTATSGEQVWIVADAILNEDWLRAWEYYWPNGYERDEIIQTWHSVAIIMANADVIVPGHGLPFRVTPELINCLIAGFVQAEYAKRCPDVAETLRKRVEHFPQ
jgi:glyoxylase-like metal-dependent hydrolase (beta-lactamase superfamily II)